MSDILTVKEAAKLTRLSVGTVYQYVERKRLPHLKVGAKLLFEREALLGWLASHRVSTLDAR